MDEVRVAILSGGAATRAGGVNKSFLVPPGATGGEPILERQLRALAAIDRSRFLVVTDRPDDYAPYGLATAPDPAGGGERSVARGFAAALGALPGEWVFVLACDMPSPDAGVLEATIAALASAGDGRRAAVLASERGPEPFHGLYHASLAEDPFGAAARAAGKLPSMRRLLADRADVLALAPADLARFGISRERFEACLENANR